MKISKHILTALCLTLVLSAFLGMQNVFAQTNNDDSISITVIGNEDTGTLVEQTNIPFSKGSSAFSIFQKQLGDQLHYKKTDIGKMVTGIKGLKTKDTYFFAFYINGVLAPVGLSHYQVQPGDQLGLRYMNWKKPKSETVHIKVIGKDGKKLVKQAKVSFVTNDKGQTPTAFTVFRVHLNNQLSYKTFDFGKMIQGIKGVKVQSGEAFWGFYINGKMADQGVSQYHVQPGDQLALKYTPIKSADDQSDASADDKNKNEKSDQATSSNTDKSSSVGKMVDSAAVNRAIQAASQYLREGDLSIWGAVAFSQLGLHLPESFQEQLLTTVKKAEGTFKSITDYEKYTIGLAALGEDPTSVGSYNIVKPIYTGDVTSQGINGVIYGLLALNSIAVDIPNDAQWTREALLQYLLDKQNKDGGWTGYTEGSSPDITSMALAALVPYQSQKDVKQAIKSAVAYLEQQAAKLNNSATAAQMIIGLSAVNVDPTSDRFATASGQHLLAYLLSFQKEKGGFSWKEGKKPTAFSTVQPLSALAAYQMYVQDQGSLYTFAKQQTDKQQASPQSSNSESSAHNQTEGSFSTYGIIILAGVLVILIVLLIIYIRKKRTQS